MRLLVKGQPTLRGDYYPSGNSNAAIAALVATMLTPAPSTITPFPHTLSTTMVKAIAETLGATLTTTGESLSIQTPYLNGRMLTHVQTQQIGASILFLAPILARRSHVRLEWARPLSRLHAQLVALRDLGIEIKQTGTIFEISAERWQYRDIILLYPSVTTTALVCMLAAALGHKTIIRNAASEPHVRILQHQLVQMGAKIEGIGSNLVTIEGWVDEPKGAEVRIPYDHIEIASVAIIGAITAGHLSIHHVNPSDLQLILKIFNQLGVKYFIDELPESGELTLHIPDNQSLHVEPPLGETNLTIDTSPWPGFPSDLVAITTVLATQARGSVLIHEKLFNDRLLFVDKLKSMGAQIVLADPHRAVVFGKRQLHGEYIDSPDVRVGLALLAAALCAEGESIIDNAQLVDWAFQDIRKKLTQVGAQFEVIEA
ncbi:MAG: UDP-N-acetylglucosamine 1-carboxyvinyltransferase [Phototrophicales bacterium]|nr:MAG: UDP-N-acetylglucosamine 1-carboxyvinyltransferase [Phototrophicales bacterium]